MILRNLVYIRCCLIFLACLLPPTLALAQSNIRMLQPILQEQTISPDVLLFQMRQYLLSRIAKPPKASSATEWTAEAGRLRERFLDVVFHGWPREWVTAPHRFEELGVIESGKGYRMRKLRYEILPGFSATGILYEPEVLKNKVPAILNVNGHEITLGKATEYKQKHCINFAKRGMLVLNLEWFGTGEMNLPGNKHWFGSHLDLVGMHGVGLFYLQMRKGLDYLYLHPNVDRNRLAMTGLSGGSWQTVVLSALDERVKVIIPVAGFSSLQQRVEARDFGSIGDVEQMATDFFDGYDYTHLTALLAPRPTLLIYNAEDDCCFRTPLVRPLVFDAILPFFKLYRKDNAFEWYDNLDPGTHNYHLDNRQQAYRFFNKHLNWPGPDNEIPSDSEIMSAEELTVGLPEANLSILDLARMVNREIKRSPVPVLEEARNEWVASERSKLRSIIRYEPVSMVRPWMLANTRNRGVETLSYMFEMNNRLSASAVWAKATHVPQSAPVTIILNDEGKRESGAEVVDRVNRGEQVLAVDLLFKGDSARIYKVSASDPENFIPAPISILVQIFHAVGDRAIGLEAAQLVEITQWIMRQSGRNKVRLESRGIRSQVVALVSAAMKPELFSEIVVQEGMASFSYLFEKPVEFRQAPELFCLDLYKNFDLDNLTALAEGVRISHSNQLTLPIQHPTVRRLTQ
jgi:Acetyl xylan esterase (AXE1)